MIVLKPIIGLFSYVTYSFLQRKYLDSNTYAMMQVLSEMRKPPMGNTSNIPIIANKMKNIIVDDMDTWNYLSGDEDILKSNFETRISKDIACCYTQSGKTALFGKNPKRNLSLGQLVSTKTKQIENVEDIYERVNWNDRINECKFLGAKVNNVLKDGKYIYCYRDYVNFEELLGMVSKRFGVERFLYHGTQAGILNIHKETSYCTFTERPKLFTFIPLKIQWQGNVIGDKIVWNSSSMDIGWKNTFLHKFIDRPAAAERLRQANWSVKFSNDCANGDIVCCYREGVGHMVLAREECLFQKKSWVFGFGRKKR